MAKFFSAVMESVADLPLRPLLLAAGAAATAASISYLVKRDDGETADPEDTEYQATIISPAWCPVCEQATEPALVQSTKVHQDQMMQEAIKVIAVLEKERFKLEHQVKTLQDKVKDMENQLCDTHLQQEQEAHRLLKSEHQEMMETLTNNEKLLKVSLFEAEEKHQKAVETITKLEVEKSDLTDQVKTLRDTVEDMGNQLCETRLQYDDLKNISLAKAEEKHQMAVETITQLEEEKSDLTDQVKTLIDTVEVMGNQLCETFLQCEREQEAHRLLKSEYQEMMETLTNSEKLKKVSLFEAEEKHQKAVETITKLEVEKSDLTDQVKTLRDTVEDMGNQLYETRLQYDDLKNISLAKAEEKHQMAVETITQLEEEKSDLTDQVKTLIDTVEVMGNQLCETFLQCEREQEAHRLLKSEYQEMMETLTNNESLLKVSLAEAEEKHQKAVETITQLEEEKSDLTDQVKTLRDTVEDMGNQLFHTYLRCDELKNEWEEEQEAHRLLKSEYQERMENLTNNEKLLKVSLSEAEEKHQKAVETITKLEEEKSDLTDQVKTLRDTVEDMGNQLCETHLQCDDLKNEWEEEQEAHRLLKSKYQERMENLTNNEKLLKVSLFEAEEKHQKAVETINLLEVEKSDLTDQVKTLQETVEDMGNQLCETRLHCEKEQEAHRLLKSEHQEMMETLTNSEKLLKVSLSETEEKHQKAVETITRLEEEKSDLTDQVKTLQDIVEDMGNQLCYIRFRCDDLKNEWEDKQEAHRLLKSQYQERMENLTNNEKLLKESMAVQSTDEHEAGMSGLTNVAMQDTVWDKFKKIFKKKPGKSHRSKKNRLPEPENVLKSSGCLSESD
ncbi:myosin-4-like [Hemibagrus wyckioides]|uniref:myosin-4-like n=1 Tax=Hemibagrus wyckioides TaxID=337641 RepID=UPI00266B6CA0|nr:myosin-4-like [Hemibagrus wyckioides]